MAINVVIPLLIPLEENIHNATRLLSGSGTATLEFSEPRYCALVAEDAPVTAPVITVVATHKTGSVVRFTITGGNRDGLFTIDQHSGTISLAATLDYELHHKHELVVSAEGGSDTVHAIVQVRVRDINDNAPYFTHPDPKITIVEEDDRDLPATITKVLVVDPDTSDHGRLVYRLSGNGVDDQPPGDDPFFTINARTGDLIQLRALDRDPPYGRGVWRLKVEVRDGQGWSEGKGDTRHQTPASTWSQQHSPKQQDRQASWGHQEPEKVTEEEVAEERSRHPNHRQNPSKLASSHSVLSWGHQGPVSNTEEDVPERKRPPNYLKPSKLAPSQSLLNPRIFSYIRSSSSFSSALRSSRGITHNQSLRQLSVSSSQHSFTYNQTFPNFSSSSSLTSQSLSHNPDLSASSPRRQHPIDNGRIAGNTRSKTRNVGEKIVRNEREVSTLIISKPLLDSTLYSQNVESAIKVNEATETKQTRMENIETTSAVGDNNSEAEIDELNSVVNSDSKHFRLNIVTSVNKVNLKSIGQSKKTSLTSLSDPWVNSQFSSISSHTRNSSQFFNNTMLTDRVENIAEPLPRHRETDVNKNIPQTRTSRNPPNSYLMSQSLSHDMQKKPSKFTLEPKKDKMKKNADLTIHQLLLNDNKSSTPRKGLGKLLIKPHSHSYTARVTEPKKAEEISQFLSYTDNKLNFEKLEMSAEEFVRGHLTSPEQHPYERSPSSNLNHGHIPNPTKTLFSPVLKHLNVDPIHNPTNIQISQMAINSKPGYAPKSTNAQLSHAHEGDPTQDYVIRNPRSIVVEGTGCDELDDLDMHGGDETMVERRVHVMETVVTVVVKDINDNSPVFTNHTMFGQVQENGPPDLPVVTVRAWDADDEADGTNARLSYSIEKNVIDESSGEAIFSMEPGTGLVRTSLCCLDRETTPEYTIQVVASDGGGLKGTGTVVVRVQDQNDNSPRLTRRHWQIEVDETPATDHNATDQAANLLELSVVDKDTTNRFVYRVVAGSGRGWDMFGVRGSGASGHLYATRPLDYENQDHRKGFRFMVQVTDMGVDGWNDSSRVDSAWVEVRVRDLNDNPPVFSRPHAHVTVSEDATPYTLLASLPATDPDMGGSSGVDYKVEGGWGALTVNGAGGILLRTTLDREAVDGDEGEARIVAVDRGRPPLSATATLTITVTDVNDCPPTLLPPTLLHITENSPPASLGVLRATDPDLWAMGHGPPFNFTLDPSNEPYVLALVSLKFDPHLDSGRGGAEVMTRGKLDREEHRELSVGVRVADAEGRAATHTITIIVDDVNDNPMKPAAKMVYLWKTQGGGSEAPLGRVFVSDPDDWDLDDKTFKWATQPHPLFTLHPTQGTIFAATQLRQGRYELQFSVSDRVWRQDNVSANVTVVVRLLAPEALAHAAPLALSNTTPAALTRGWTPASGGGGLGLLLQGVLEAIDEKNYSVEVVSVYGPCGTGVDPAEKASLTPSTSTTTTTPSNPLPGRWARTSPPQDQPSAKSSSACVWVSAKDPNGRFMDPVKLGGLLALHTRQLEAVTGVRVSVGDPGVSSTPLHPHLSTTTQDPPDPLSATSLASTALPLQVVDTNSTSLVTPRLSHAHAHTCRPPARIHPHTCTHNTCLNGGRCLRSSKGNRCVCPGGTWGPRCKVLSRTFVGQGWAWVPPLPPCLPTTLSLRVLTTRTHGLLLYSGPLSPAPTRATPTPMLALQLVEGRPELLLEGRGGPLKLQVNATLHDGQWHTLHISLDTQGATLMVDLCGRNWENGSLEGAHCLSREQWKGIQGRNLWLGAEPLQIGGVAHSALQAEHHRWQQAPTSHNLHGCISRLAINTQVVDLGEPAYSDGSSSGCRPQEEACQREVGVCGVRGQCAGGLKHPRCECDPGWTGSECATATVPARLGVSSYMKLALSFTPALQEVTVQVRIRTAGQRNGLVLHMAAHHRTAAFSLYLREGVVCASVSGTGLVEHMACVEGQAVSDGRWHTIEAGRYGHNLVVSVDDGDEWHRNESLVLVSSPPPPLHLDKHDGVTVGGLPEFVGVNLITVHHDLQNTCLDDLRVSDHSLPLSPALNGTSWGQVTTLEQLEKGCHPSTSNPCKNITCAPPLSCHSAWGQPTCSCGEGRQLVGRRCEDLDECAWSPCLYGGTCHNQRPGYLCVCDSDHLGDNCQWSKLAPEPHPLAAPPAIAAITVSVLVLVVLGVILSFRLHRLRVTRSTLQNNESGEKGSIYSLKDTGEFGVEGISRRRKALQEDPAHESLLQLLKLKLTGNQSKSRHKKDSSEDEGSGGNSDDGCTVSGDSHGGGVSAVVLEVRPRPPLPLGHKVDPTVILPTEDLRAYAYEGDGSSSGSLGSAISGRDPQVFALR